MISFMGSWVESRLEHGTTVALANIVGLAQHPQLAEQRVVPRRVENIAYVALPHPARLAQHPALLVALDARDGRAREHVGAEQDGAGKAVDGGCTHCGVWRTSPLGISPYEALSGAGILRA